MDTSASDHRENMISSIETIEALRDNGHFLRNCTVRGLDLRSLAIDWDSWEIENTSFLGCKFSLDDECKLRRKGAFIISEPPSSYPFDPFRTRLYTWRELLEGLDEAGGLTTDLRIYRHFEGTRFNPSVNDALWQRLHDHAIDDALRKLLIYDEDGMTSLRCVGFMGGHSASRGDIFYEKVARTAKLLAEEGYFIATGGGPGIMEAANLGAYFAHQPEDALRDALITLKAAPYYQDEAYHQRALSVLEVHPEGNRSLAVPTWFYGHEPTNLFASHIAKYFSNSIREDTLLALSLYGIVFAPGSAGTTQEIFMEAAQNHYGTFNYFSPMVFLGRQRYEIDTLIFPLLRQLAWGRKYYSLLHITDEPSEVVDFLLRHPPAPKEDKMLTEKPRTPKF